MLCSVESSSRSTYLPQLPINYYPQDNDSSNCGFLKFQPDNEIKSSIEKVLQGVYILNAPHSKCSSFASSKEKIELSLNKDITTSCIGGMVNYEELDTFFKYLMTSKYFQISFKEFKADVEKKKRNLNKIENLGSFDIGWNGNNGQPFDEKLIETFFDTIKDLYLQPDIAPTGRKSLQIQYELVDKSFLGFEIFADKITKLEVPQRLYSKAIVSEAKEGFVDFINDSLRSFYGSK